MGLFDFFSTNINKRIDKAKRVMLNEHHQSTVRQEAIQELVGYDHEDAIAALVERLGHNFRDTIKNEQERQWIRHFLVEKFQDRSIEPLKNFITGNQSISGAIVTLKELITEEDLTTFLLDLLQSYEPQDHRSTEARLQLIDALDEQSGYFVEILLPYTLDHSDDIRIKVINLLEEQIRGVEGDHDAVIRALISVMTDPYATGRIVRSAANALIRMQANLKEYASLIQDDVPDQYSFKKGVLKAL
jgi:HEAT repeat protein